MIYYYFITNIVKKAPNPDTGLFIIINNNKSNYFNE